MHFINWGLESPEQLAIRRRLEQEAIYEQAIRALQARNRAGNAPGVGSGRQVIENTGWIESALAALNLRWAEVTSLVPNRYCFWDDYVTTDSGPTFTGINDGGDDMYDGANFINTNLTADWDEIKEGGSDDGGPLTQASVQYTHTQADNEDDDPNQYFNPPMDGTVEDGTPYFGAGSKYFTNMYPGLFIMICDGASISEFNVSGNVGSDGEGIGAGYVDEVIPGWTLFYKTNTDSGTEDPSINQLILVPGESAGITQEWDTSSDWDDHRLTGLAARPRIIYAVVARTPGEDVLALIDAVAVAQKILEITL